MGLEQYSISVIVPTLNEEKHIAGALEFFLQLDNNLELIVADGGSSDATVEKAQRFAITVTAPRGRGAQMNAGAAIANGDVLWFIHADCRPHPDSVKAMNVAIELPWVVGGAFQYTFQPLDPFLWLSCYLSNLKNRILNLVFGDMGIFVRREVFEQLGGYAEIPLMEDMDFCKRLKQHGKVVILPQKIVTSARRWIEEGYVKNSLRSWILQSAWAMGVSPQTLAKWYRFN